MVWVALNAWAFTMFAVDKWSAENKERRVPEKSLLALALIGGSIGAVAGQQILRHKTYKEPFRTILFGIAALHLGLLSFFLFKTMF